MLTFPTNPSLGQEAVTGGKTWRWDGTRWQNVGVVGYQGSTGYQGSAGVQGIAGYEGSAGVAGPTGYQGSQGAPGGPTGYTGSMGNGYTGSAGATRLRDLTDVDISMEANSYILTYVASSDKYSILPINVSNTTINNSSMDGGTF